MATHNNAKNFLQRRPLWQWLLLALIVAGGFLWYKNSRPAVADVPTFEARRGSLDITVLEGGSLQALESQEIKCEVRVGYQGTKILKIIEEGYLVTEEDVKSGKVLVELDSSEIEKQIVQQEIQYQSAAASLTDAQQNYEIQLNQNQSDISAAEQKARFARMDFDKFLGDTVTQQIVQRLGLAERFAQLSTNDVEHNLRSEKNPDPPLQVAQVANVNPSAAVIAKPGVRIPINGTASSDAPVVTVPPAAPETNGKEAAEPTVIEMPALNVDFSEYAKLDVLGDGEAKQKLRKFEDDLQVAQKELGQAKATLEGTQRLFEKGFVTRTDLQRDEIAYENSRLKVQTAETARALFLKYEFPKAAEEFLSKYVEAMREVEKARRLAVSKLAQARAKLNSAKGQYEVQVRQKKDLEEQLKKCTLRAEKSGLVVYGSGGDEMIYYGDQERIREGATVRERQTIITIPDMTQMAVRVKIHESYIKKVKRGQKARITVDAFPDQPLTGEVSKVGVLPDSQNRWMNPDLKVYVTTINIEGTHDWVKPGMSAKVEILVNHLEDVVYVPVQAVSSENGKQFCYLASGERRVVETGDFTDEFIEIKSGLQEGEPVLLRSPQRMVPEKSPDNSKPAPGEPATPATADSGKVKKS